MSVIEFVVTVWWLLVMAYLCVFVHEVGHLITGRVVGVPRHGMKMVLRGVPHVALHDGSSWRAPDDAGYAGVFSRRYNDSAGGAWLFVAGGFLVETLAVVVMGWALYHWATEELAALLYWASFGVFVLYVGLDVVMSFLRRAAHGDASAMCEVNRSGTAVFLAAILVVKAAAVWAVSR